VNGRQNLVGANAVRRVTLCATVATGLVLVGAGAAFADVVTSEADSGKTILVPMGQPLVVNLTGAKDSGRYWRLDADLTPELVLWGRTATSLDMPGATQTTTFTFSTNAPGNVLFKASYIKAGAPIPKSSDVSFAVSVTP
jgi:hypothetical protein